MTCQCDIPEKKLYCERHKVWKYRRLVELCNAGARGQTRGLSYWTAWEAGRGPGQPGSIQAKVIRQRSGPGSELKRILSWAFIKEQPGCKCHPHQVQMDSWGPDGCREHLDEIVGWLEEEAGKRGLPFVRTVVKVLVWVAIRRAECKLAEASNNSANAVPPDWHPLTQ